MTAKPWREVAVPRQDVREGRFLQSEFAADLAAVREGRAPEEYQDAPRFFERTFITEGMGNLLVQVARRLLGQDAEPVVQLQTAFGGGKTHTLLAVYHLATRRVPLGDLPGVASLLDREGLEELPAARAAVLDGNDLAPSQPRLRGDREVRTLWGELAWQLGGTEGYDLVAPSDQAGTSPGKEVLAELLRRHAPCVVLLDELVAYVRQFPENRALPGGTFESQLSFLQALTEATKGVRGAQILASLPESRGETGGGRGEMALRSLEKTFGRVQALWKPVAAEEAFEIVRRRLFEPLGDLAAPAETCRAFEALYAQEGDLLPPEVREGRYRDRMAQAFPIHPEVFQRLYEDWTPLEGFQRTRGVLKLLAKAIHRLWRDDNRDLMILPGSLPLQDRDTRNELLAYLPQGWDPVVDRDVDGDRSEPGELDSREGRFGSAQAARRVARTLFLGTAPASASAAPGNRGIPRSRVLLGCLQPDQTPSVYGDALNRLADRLHYLNASGDKGKPETRFWFGLLPNLRREMEERKLRLDELRDLYPRLRQEVGRVFGKPSCVDGVHPFTPSGDVPDDDRLRLVVLPPEAFYAREESRLAAEGAGRFLEFHGDRPRHHRNRLLFLAADHGARGPLMEGLRTLLAWESIVRDLEDQRLNLDQHQGRQAREALKAAERALPQAIRGCYRWLLCPLQDEPGKPVTLEAFALNAQAPDPGRELERVLRDNEAVVFQWAPFHLRELLRRTYWRPETPWVRALEVWEHCLNFPYLPRLRDRGVWEATLKEGCRQGEFFGTARKALGEGEYGDFRLGEDFGPLDESLLLLEPQEAARYREALEEGKRPGEETIPPANPEGTSSGVPKPDTVPPVPGEDPKGTPPGPPTPSMREFHASVDIPPGMAKLRLMELAEEILAPLLQDLSGELQVTLEIHGTFPQGLDPNIRRAVSENARTLKIDPIWE